MLNLLKINFTRTLCQLAIALLLIMIKISKNSYNFINILVLDFIINIKNVRTINAREPIELIKST